MNPLRSSTRKLASNFCDVKVVRVRGGLGGDGVAHFARDAFKPIAPPDGGDGGRGGNVYVEITRPAFDLSRLQNRYTALPGGHGQNNRGRGGLGEDVVIPVPKGTVITELPLEESAANSSDVDDAIDDNNISPPVPMGDPLFIDTSHPWLPLGTKFLVAIGGQGGYGNFRFKSSINRSPMESTPGQPGHLRRLHLELKTIADVGLVGLPNAGKSSFVRAVTRCKTQVGEWAFTTLAPSLGTIDCLQFLDPSSVASTTITDNDDQSKDSGKRDNAPVVTAAAMEECSRITVADIPGIVDGASENRGLGHEFLRHIERASVLGFVVDLSARDAVHDLEILVRELERHETKSSGRLKEDRKALVIANKADAVQRDGEDVREHVRENYRRLCEWSMGLRDPWPVIAISAKYKKNLEKAVGEIQRLVIEQRAMEAKRNKELRSELMGGVVSDETERRQWAVQDAVKGVSAIVWPDFKS